MFGLFDSGCFTQVLLTRLHFIFPQTKHKILYFPELEIFAIPGHVKTCNSVNPDKSAPGGAA